MQILVWVEYEIVGDDEYSYVEKIREPYFGKDSAWRNRFVRSLLARRIVVKSIKELEKHYTKSLCSEQ